MQEVPARAPRAAVGAHRRPTAAPANEAVTLRAFLLGVQEAIKGVPAAWVRCEMHLTNAEAPLKPRRKLGLWISMLSVGGRTRART